MTTYLFAGGGTAGHVNPLLATADIALVGDAAELLAALEAELVGRFPDAS